MAYEIGQLRVRRRPSASQRTPKTKSEESAIAYADVCCSPAWSEMQIDPPLLSALAALVGALIGGGASLAAAIYTQRYQDRQQRVARETTKREGVYADFIMSASKLLLKAHLSGGLTLGGDER